LLAEPPKNVQKAKIVPPYGIQLFLRIE